jgi:hypothetical protein
MRHGRSSLTNKQLHPRTGTAVDYEGKMVPSGFFIFLTTIPPEIIEKMQFGEFPEAFLTTLKLPKKADSR